MSDTPRPDTADQDARARLIVRTCDDITTLAESTWDALVGDGSACLEWGLLSAFETTGCVGGDSGWLASHLVVEDESGRLLAAAPMYVKGHSAGEFVFDHAWADAAHRAGLRYYPKLVVAVPFTPVHGPRILTAPDAGDPSSLRRLVAASAIRVAQAAGTSGVHWLFTGDAADQLALDEVGYARRLGVQYHWHNRGYADFEDWLEGFTSKRRRTIRRERRSLAAAGLDIRVYEGDALTAERMDTMYELYLTTIDKKIWGRQYLDRAFFRELGARFAKRLMVVTAERDGRVAAGSLFIHKNGELHGRYWGCFEEVPFLHFEVCYYKPVEICIERGWRLMGAGAQGGHKYERGFDPMLTCSHHHLVDPRLDAAVRAYLDEEREAVEAELAEMRERSPCRRVRTGPPST